MSESLKELSDRATPGEWHVGKHFEYEGFFLTDQVSNLGDDMDADDLAFIVALVNAYRAGQLHDDAALSQARADALAQGRREGLEEAAKEASLLAANQCEGPMIGDEHGNFSCALVASLREVPRVEFHQQDWIPGFAAFAPNATTLNPDSRAFCVVNLGSILACIQTGDTSREELPYFLAESMMHEVIHAIEQWAGAEFSEERVEALLDRYRSASLSTAPAETQKPETGGQDA